jgi:hypothetical protein
MRIRSHFRGLLLLVCSCLKAQDTQTTPNPAGASAGSVSADTTTTLSAPSVEEKWKFFVNETATPLLLGEVVPGATLSQLTRSAPLYGKHFWRHYAYLKRIGATTGDDVSQNFFSDFVLASAFHEDTRYVRQGPARHGVVWRVGYAVSRSVVTRTDAGNATFDWANVVGCAMSAALSNAYYPAVSRTRADSLTNWGTNIAGSGLSNLLPEFGPGVGRFFKRHLFHSQQ